MVTATKILALFFNDNELVSKPIFSIPKFCNCHPQKILHYLSIKQYSIPISYVHSILSNVLKIEAPMMHHIILCWNVFSSQILVSQMDIQYFLHKVFIPSLNHTYSHTIRCYTFNLQSSSVYSHYSDLDHYSSTQLLA